MNKQNLVAAIVFIGLCTVLLGSPGEPNSALKVVAHDATLTGDGTLASPLGVAQQPGAGVVRVVDSLGKNVGMFYPPIFVARKIDGFAFTQLNVGVNGFQSSSWAFVHTTTDCSGTRYLEHDFNRLDRNFTQSNTHLYYPAEPIQQIVIRSQEIFRVGQPTGCNQLIPTSVAAGVVATVEFSSLGLVPPFHLEF